MATTRAYYDAPIPNFLTDTSESVIGTITRNHSQDILHTQSNAWRLQIELLKAHLTPFLNGHIFFEFVIPRMARRTDVVLFLEGMVIILEFKVGANDFTAQDARQVEGYALDLKNFHSGSHNLPIVPILVATQAKSIEARPTPGSDDVFMPIFTNGTNLTMIIESLRAWRADPGAHALDWANAPYKPTPTIVEAAKALYAQHSVYDIARNDAGAQNLGITSQVLRNVVNHSMQNNRKSICFLTGVPGSGKTRVGLNLTSTSSLSENAVFLSGNGPLVDVLREALSQDDFARYPQYGVTHSRRKVRSFIQNIHHFRDDGLNNSGPPAERIVVFDEAQRAWDGDYTAKFMLSKRNQRDWDLSEPDYLIQIMDRHHDWCVIVALVGGGQEINSGEVGLQGWFDSLRDHYPHWDVYYSRALLSPEYDGGSPDFSQLNNSICESYLELHLSTSLRSFRAETLSTMVHHLVAGDSESARKASVMFRTEFPLRVTRDLNLAKRWLHHQARGIDSKGIVASSGAIRLKPYGIHVKHKISAPYWFLKDSEDVRSSHFLEDVATEFDVQGLELDWGIVAWDGDLRFVNTSFEHWDFRGTAWNRRNSLSGQRFLENAYRVLLTRFRQGMVIFVPEGDISDSTRQPQFYDGTYAHLLACGVPELREIEV